MSEAAIKQWIKRACELEGENKRLREAIGRSIDALTDGDLSNFTAIRTALRHLRDTLKEE